MVRIQDRWVFVWFPFHSLPIPPSPHLPHWYPSPIQTELTVVLHTPNNTHLLLLPLLTTFTAVHSTAYQHSTGLRRERGRVRESYERKRGRCTHTRTAAPDDSVSLPPLATVSPVMTVPVPVATHPLFVWRPWSKRNTTPHTTYLTSTPPHTTHLHTLHTSSHYTPPHTTHLHTLHTSSHYTPPHTTHLLTLHTSSHYTPPHTTHSYYSGLSFNKYEHGKVLN